MASFFWILPALLMLAVGARYARPLLLRPPAAAGNRAASLPQRRGSEEPGLRVSLDGMPSFSLASPVAPGERIPWLFIYVPVVLKWFALAWRYRSLTLPTVANPCIAAGGFRAESKMSYLSQIPARNQRWVARSLALRVPGAPGSEAAAAHVERRLASQGFGYPVVVKPDIGACGFGVRLVRDREELMAYLAGFPRREKVMLQEYLRWDGEAGIYYVRLPGEPRGRIFSLGLRYYPYVVGDGHATLRDLIAEDPRASRRAPLHAAALGAQLERVPAAGERVRLALVGSLRVGALYRDGNAYITPELSARIDDIARSMPEFYCGRFDLRFDSIDSLQRGEGFRLIEVNGAGAEAIHIWDPELTIGNAYRVLFEQHEILFEVSARNRARGYRPLSLREVIGLQWRESVLLRRYPQSN